MSNQKRIIEDATYLVRMKFTGTIAFAPIERDRPITRQDAIDNAIGTLPDGTLEAFEAEGWDVEFEAEKVIA